MKYFYVVDERTGMMVAGYYGSWADAVAVCSSYNDTYGCYYNVASTWV